MSVRKVCAAVVVVIAPVFGGCVNKTVPAPPPVTPTGVSAADAKTDPATQAGAGSTPIETGGLHVGAAIAAACGLPKQDAAPRFDFDEATIAPEDRDLLSAIARCVSDGPLRGATLALIGRADPRGEGEYNMGLGELRADSVERYLHDLGVHPDHVHATSRGKLDATGTDEETWAKDRRVDIELASR